MSCTLPEDSAIPATSSLDVATVGWTVEHFGAIEQEE
jgi:hypothetical protein